MQSKKALKLYPIHQSPLFRIRGKGQFGKVLNVDWDATAKLLPEDNYRVWVNEKGREIQQPMRWLAQIHNRLGKLLSRIELPDYVYSQKGRSYADNARIHVGGVPLIKTDIRSFYPSTSWKMVYQMFVQDFKCAADVSHLLADICCYKQEHLPTGSPLSGRVAFFASKPMFDEISEIASEEDCKMSLYVDDLTISGPGATKNLLGRIRKTISQHGYKTKQAKSITYSSESFKPVTGAIVASDSLRLPNKRHKKIWEARKNLASANPAEKVQLLRSLRGREQEAKQIT